MNKFTIDKLDYFGRGIIRNDKDIIFVSNALKDDVVDIEITKNKKNIKEARVVKYYRRSKDYRESICPFSDICGGCDIINLEYKEQLKFKKEKTRDLVSRMLKEDVVVNDIIYSNEFNYRNKIVMHGKDNCLGLYQKKSNDLVEVDKCYLVTEEINNILKRVKEYIDENKCIINDLTIKVTTLKEVMISIYGSFDYEDFRKKFSDIKVIYINNQLVTKDSYIKEKLFDKYFYISHHSFFQVNKYTTELLYDKVLSYIKKLDIEKALDLYCGTGTMTILASSYVRNIYGIEIEKDAINDANKNKELNQVNNVSFILGKVEDNLDDFKDIDLIIVDPPREGLDKKTKEQLKRIKAKNIIYVSCDPATLMRDLKELKDIYNIEEITPVDMFPNTHHVECVSALSRKAQ